MNFILKNNVLILFTILFSSNVFSQININANQVCLGNATTLSGIYSPNDSVVSQWYWDLNNNGLFNNDSGQVVGYVFPQPDTNWIGLKVTFNAGGADSILSFPIIVYPEPNVNFHVDNNCAFQAAEYIDQSFISSGTIDQYLWDFNNDNIIDDNSGPNVFYTVGPASTYVSKLTCVSNLGCSAFATKTTEVFPTPNANFSTNNICIEDSALFVNNSNIINGTIDYNLWDFDDNNVDISSSNVYHTYTNPGSYQVSLIVTSDNNCRDTSTAYVTVNPLPDVSLSYAPDSALIDGETVSISVVGTATNYLWSTGESGNNITVSDTGMYSVLVSDVNGCSSELETYIYYIEDKISVNHIITPNGDGYNDIMEILNVESIGPCNVSIYNRWNDIVFSTSDYKNDWECTYNGKPLDAGTYFYSIDCNGETKVGSINILR